MGIDTIGRRRAVFLDRDGVLNRNGWNPATGDYEAPLTAAAFVPAPGAMKALQHLQRAGFLLFLVSNQPNFAKGKSTLEELAAIHRKLLDVLAHYEVNFAEFYYCFHHPNGVRAGFSYACACRKPSPYFLHQASREFDVSLADSWMIGDRATDIECGCRAGVRTIRVAEDHPATRACGEAKADFEARDLAHAAVLLTRQAQLPHLSLLRRAMLIPHSAASPPIRHSRS